MESQRVSGKKITEDPTRARAADSRMRPAAAGSRVSICNGRWGTGEYSACFVR